MLISSSQSISPSTFSILENSVTIQAILDSFAVGLFHPEHSCLLPRLTIQPPKVPSTSVMSFPLRCMTSVRATTADSLLVPCTYLLFCSLPIAYSAQ